MNIHGIAVSPQEFAEGQPALFWQAPKLLAEAMAAAVGPRTVAVFAHVNHGRWVVACPDCNGAQLACLTDHRFMCHVCANVAADGLWRPVIWPAEVTDISSVMAKRTDRRMQNYEPGETVKDLREQNEVLDGAAILGGQPLQLQGDAYPKGHKHAWPKRATEDVVYTCSGCGAMYDGAAIQSERRGGS